MHTPRHASSPMDHRARRRLAAASLILGTLGGPALSRAAVAQPVPTAGTTVAPAPAIRWLEPTLSVGWASGVPDPRADGAAWSGVGLDVALRAGLAARLGPLRLQLAPELHANENRDHPFFPSGDPARDPFASPFYHGEHSADLPSRPGAGAFRRVMPGESALWWRGGHALVALTSSTPDWGPRGAAGEGIVFGRSAPGLPRLEIDLAHFGADALALRWFGGVARESAWFDDDPSNDWRSVSGLRAEYAHRLGLTAGLSRTVMQAGDRPLLGGAVAPLARARRDRAIELVALDVAYADSALGTLTWLELARQAPITGLGDLLRAPTEGIAYRFGVTQRVARSPTATWNASLEYLRLEQSGTRSDPTPRDLYTSPVVTHGWTHLGQPLGTGIGPGGQRQFAAIERLGATWTLRAFAERVRWNEDAMLREPGAATDRHDVTLQGGVGAGRRVGGYDVAVRLSAGRRLNHLFQGASVTPDGQPVDRRLFALRLTVARAGDARIVAVPYRP